MYLSDCFLLLLLLLVSGCASDPTPIFQDFYKEDLLNTFDENKKKCDTLDAQACLKVIETLEVKKEKTSDLRDKVCNFSNVLCKENGSNYPSNKVMTIPKGARVVGQSFRRSIVNSKILTFEIFIYAQQ